MSGDHIFLTERQVILLKQSFRQVDTSKVSSLFYEKLFEYYPFTKSYFPDDISELRLKLISVLELVVFSFSEVAYDRYELQSEVIVPLRDLGMKHDKLEISHDLYPIANRLLTHALRESDPSLFTPEVLQAWELALQHLVQAMLNNKVATNHNLMSLRDTYSYIRKKISQKFLK